VVETPPYNRFQNAFSHIFAGGYAAGYYSYLWAEVMACDLFGLFAERGIYDAESAQLYQDTFLACGGAVEPAELFKQCRGRAPDIHALLRHDGLLDPVVSGEER
jgi:oligopeptidase A